MADIERDALMRLTGELRAANQLVEMINVSPDLRRVRDLVESANTMLRRAVLAAWEAADDSPRSAAG